MSSSGRAVKSLGSRHAVTASQQPESDASNRIKQPNRRHAITTNRTHDEFPDDRATKRRKLEIRGPRQQTTLDGFLRNHSNSPRPPVKIAAIQSNGAVIETTNGVQNELPVANIEAVVNNGADNSELACKVAKKAAAQKQEDKRTLRSQDDGPRLKSELATYFNNYEDIIFDAPRELELLNADTSIHITDDAPAKQSKAALAKGVKAVRGEVQPWSKLDMSPMMHGLPNEPEDPLTDDAFLVSHRRAERKEKQMRNIEREHAMHEKVQLERLLDGLLGHDWLRVLGITGVTESEAKKFERKRDYFVREVRGLVNKFNVWKEEEKRQKYEREAMLAAEREAEDDAEASTESSSIDLASSDLNLSASRQLQQETTASATKLLSVPKTKRNGRATHAVPSSPVPYRPPSPITSFYPSRHLRESALKKTRNSRSLMAFGLPLPEVLEHEFALPPDYITYDVLRASARERRRKNRESTANAVNKG